MNKKTIGSILGALAITGASAVALAATACLLKERSSKPSRGSPYISPGA